MLTCPMCKKRLGADNLETKKTQANPPTVVYLCRACKADVTLLVDYVDSLQDSVAQAEALTRSGELGDAVWKYLEVLEVDPDNATARRQVGKVATAVREFDKASPARGLWRKLRKQGRFRRWLASFSGDEGDGGWFASIYWVLVLVCVFILGYLAGVYQTRLNLPEHGTASVAKP